MYTIVDQSGKLIVPPAELLNFSEASKVIPGRPSIQTIWRWATQKRGPVLDTVTVGKQRFTHPAAIAAFIEANAAKDIHRPRRTSIEKRKAAVARELDAAGIL